MGIGRHVMDRPRADRERIFGTWDFKWPRGKVIRVAFQRIPESSEVSEDQFIELIGRVEEFADRWNGKGNPLSLSFLRKREEWLPAPAGQEGDGGESTPDKNRYVEYDVLVSLAPLPITFDYEQKVAPEDASALWQVQKLPRVKQVFPTSQLGRFALRADYGVPTVFLGRPERTTEVQPKKLLGDNPGEALTRLTRILPTRAQTIADYFTDDTGEFESNVVHEFGHVLGLPHLHQSPVARPRWRSLLELRERIGFGTGVEVGDDFVKAQVLLTWPATASEDGGVRFSDWHAPERDDLGDPKLNSVMNHPLHDFLLAEGKIDLIRAKDPTDLDRKFLAAMYGN
jgi:hypothetical protein